METSQRTTVVGVFDRPDQAERAVAALGAAGFRDDQIGLALRGQEGGNVAGRSAEESAEHAGASAATGAVVGGVLGAIAALVIPGVGPVLALGTLGTALAGAAVGAGVGALAGGLVGMGVPEDEARYYDAEFQAGRAIVTVAAGSRYNEAQNVLRREGGHDVETRGARAGTAGDASAAATAPRRAEDRAAEDAQTLQLREEQLRVTKERVSAGAVQVRKEVVAEQRTIDVPVEREELVVERRPVNEPTAGPLTGGERAIRVPLTQERVEVEKVPVVTEEVSVGKRRVQETQQVSDTVRREEARVETTGNAPTPGPDTAGSRRTWEAEAPHFRQHWQSDLGSTGRWEEYEPYYRYGFDQYARGEWAGTSWAQAEPELRREWERRNPGQSWDVASNPIKHAWDHLSATPHTHR